MKKSSKKERLADIAEYLKLPDPLTEPHLDRFAAESRAKQIRILAELRGRTVEDNVELPLYALALSIVLAFVAGPKVIEFPENLIAAGVVGVVVGVVLTLPVLLVVGLPMFLQHLRRTDAIVLLAAYEAELSRRYSARGRSARAWQRTH